MYSIGTMYRFGQGLPKDLVQAQHWYKLAAEHGLNKGEITAFWTKMRQIARQGPAPH